MRRGITHGFPALILLPLALAWIMRAYDRRVRLRRDPTAPPADFKQLALLAALAIWTHPTLDFMNIYGMRWLMPFVNKWFYADALFIVDVYILMALGAAVWWARRAQRTRPARIGLIALAGYIIVMLGITGVGRAQVQAAGPSNRFMLGPDPTKPWVRTLIMDEGTHYQLGRWSLGGRLELGPAIPKGDSGPNRDAVVRARAHPEARPFLSWSRFPIYWVTRDGPTTVVHMEDARYRGASWASATVRLD